MRFLGLLRQGLAFIILVGSLVLPLVEILDFSVSFQIIRVGTQKMAMVFAIGRNCALAFAQGQQANITGGLGSGGVLFFRHVFS